MYPDTSGHLTSSSETVAYTYDNGGRLTTVGGYVTAMAYDPDDQLTDVTYGNGVTSRYSYDPDRRWLDWMYTRHPTSAGTYYWAQHDYDRTARTTRTRRQNHTWVDLNYDYDGVGRLQKVTSPDASREEEFHYDPLGRLTYSSMNGIHEYLDAAHVHAVTRTARGAIRAYDANGNVEVVTDPGGRDLRIRWTHDDRPATVQDLTHDAVVQFTYDAAGGRVKRRHSATGTTSYFGSLIEFTEPDKLIKYYYAGADLVARRDSSGVVYYHQDLNRSTVLQTDAAGEIANRYDYTAYGSPVFATETVPNDVTFAGARSDDETGLVYMNARYYDPVLAQFISADSVVADWADPQALNRYSYVQNDPVNSWDPTGHMPASWRVQQKKEIEARGGGYLNINAVNCRHQFVSCVSAYDGDVPRFVSAWWIGSKWERASGTYTIREYIATRGFSDRTWQRSLVFTRSVTMEVQNSLRPTVVGAPLVSPAVRAKRASRRRSEAADVSSKECVTCEFEDEYISDERQQRLDSVEAEIRRLVPAIAAGEKDQISTLLGATIGQIPLLGVAVSSGFDFIAGDNLGGAQSLAEEGLEWSVDRLYKHAARELIISPLADAWAMHTAWGAQGERVEQMKILLLERYRLMRQLGSPDAHFNHAGGRGWSSGPKGELLRNGKPVPDADRWGGSP